VFSWQKKPTDPEIIKRIPPGQVLTEEFPVLHFGRTPDYPDLSRLGPPRLGRGRVAVHAEMG